QGAGTQQLQLALLGFAQQALVARDLLAQVLQPLLQAAVLALQSANPLVFVRHRGLIGQYGFFRHDALPHSDDLRGSRDRGASTPRTTHDPAKARRSGYAPRPSRAPPTTPHHSRSDFESRNRARGFLE